MNQRFWLTPIGGAIIAVCFFLPWIEISCLGTSTYSGSDFGGVYWTIFGSGLGLLIGSLLLRRINRRDYLMSLVAALSIICVAVIFYGVLTISGGKRVLLFRVGPDDVNLKFHIGSYGTLLGLVVAWIGALPQTIRWRRRVSASSDAPELSQPTPPFGSA